MDVKQELFELLKKLGKCPFTGNPDCPRCTQDPSIVTPHGFWCPECGYPRLKDTPEVEVEKWEKKCGGKTYWTHFDYQSPRVKSLECVRLDAIPRLSQPKPHKPLYRAKFCWKCGTDRGCMCPREK